MNPSSCRYAAQPISLPEGITLRVMKASDLPHVRVLHRRLLPISYPAAFFIQLLVNPRQLCLVATEQNTIVGFASATMSPSLAGGYMSDSCPEERSVLSSDIPRSHITLLTLGVLPSYQRKGIGRSLVHGVVQRLEASAAANFSQPHLPIQSEQVPNQGSKTTVLVQVQVAQSNSAGKRFYTRLGMMDQHGTDDLRMHAGVGSRMSIMAGVLCV